MERTIFIKEGIIIPEHEIEITTSRSGGAGGQHVNKTDTRITVRWNIYRSVALNEIQKKRIVEKLSVQLTEEGDLLIHNSQSRSQLLNKQYALTMLVEIIRKALIVPKKRMATRISRAVKEARLETKIKRSKVKKMRSRKILDD